MNAIYYIEIEGQQYGPYELETLKGYGLSANTLVLKEGHEEWKYATEYPELADSIVISNIFNTNFYYKQDEQIFGPFSVYELGVLDIKSDTLLGINNTSDWRIASSVENLMDALQLLKELQEEETNKLKMLLEAEVMFRGS